MEADEYIDNDEPEAEGVNCDLMYLHTQSWRELLMLSCAKSDRRK